MPVHLRAILNALENELLPDIKKLDLTRSEFDVLHVLSNIDDASKKGVSQKFVASLAGVSDYQMTRLLTSLEEKGLVSRFKSIKSKKEKMIKLTKQGHETAMKTPTIYMNACQKIFCPLSDEETLQLQALLVKLR